MVKYFLLFVGVCYWSVGSVQAVTLDGSDLFDHDVQHTFKTISTHYRAHNEDDSILEYIHKDRVNREFKLNNIDKPLNIEPKDSFLIVNNKIPENIDKRLKEGRSNFLDVHSALVQRFGVAKRIWDLEQDLLARTKVVPRYTNEADSDDDFDLIRNWNEIDKILFGSKAEITNAQFGKKTESFSKPLDPNGRKWQVGDPRSNISRSSANVVDALQGAKALYGSGDHSIAGYLDSIKRSLGAKWGAGSLDNFSLNSEVEGKTFFEPSTSPANLDMSHRGSTVQIPGKKRLDPEVYEVQRENTVQAFFRALEDELLDRNRCEELHLDTSRDRSKAEGIKADSDECMLLRNIDLDLEVEGIRKTGNVNPDEIYGFRLSKALQMMDNHFWSFLEETKEMRSLLEDLANKPVINHW